MIYRFSSVALKRHATLLVVWKVGVPLTIMGLLWPLYTILDRPVSSPFVEAFRHGDLLLLAALVLVEVASEGDETHQKCPSQDFSWWFDLGLQVVRAASVVLIFLYAACRIVSLITVEPAEQKGSPAPIAAVHFSSTPSSSGSATNEQLTEPPAPSEPKPSQPVFLQLGPSAVRGLAFACFNCAVALLSLILSVYAALRNVNREVRFHRDSHA